MIRVDRWRLDPSSGARIQPPESWFKNAKQSTREAIAEGGSHRVRKLYSSKKVRRALAKLFYNKCAYCETELGLAGYWDVEHYRPKAEVAERPDHPGYYWLAYTWANLYTACKLCNQKHYDPATWDDPRVFPSAGKGTQFPLEDEEDRAMSPKDDLDRERPLLLDPCDSNEDPEARLMYNSLGEIKPKAADRRAQVTIDILGLNRRQLKQERRRISALVADLLEIQTLTQIKRVTQIAENQLNHLRADYATYAGVARAVVRSRKAS